MPQDRDVDGREPEEVGAVAAQAPGEDLDELREQRWPLLARVGIVVLAVAVTLFIFPLIAKLFVPPINPTQPAPPSHVSLDCQMCHNISQDVPVKPVR